MKNDDEPRKKPRLPNQESVSSEEDGIGREEANNVSSSKETSISTEEEYIQEHEDTESFVLLTDEEIAQEDFTDSSSVGANYFDSGSSTIEEESEAAWVDSDEEFIEESVNPDWLTPGESAKIQKKQKKISFQYSQSIFTARCKIKIFKSYPDLKIIVDSFNYIYILDNEDADDAEFKIHKIDLFKITDVCYFSDKILMSSNTSSFIKEISVDGKANNIKKGTGNIIKMHVYNDSLYILGDKLFRLDKNLQIKDEFAGSFKDICCLNERVLCLNDKGDIFVFSLELSFIEKLNFPFKFQFKSLYAARSFIFVGLDTGIIILNSEYKEIKTVSNLNSPITALAFTNDFIVHGSDSENSLKIVKNDLTYYNKFPYSKIKIGKILCMDSKNDMIYFSESRFISSLTINYID